MEYQVTKPSFVRINWTQVAMVFAACFAACLLAGGIVFSVIYFINRKPKALKNGYDTETRQQRPVREKEQINEVENPQNRASDRHQESDEAENHDKSENEAQKESDEETDEKKRVSPIIQLNGTAKRQAVPKK